MKQQSARLSTTLVTTLRYLPALLPWLLMKWLVNVLTAAAIGYPLWRILRDLLAGAPADLAFADGRFQMGFLVEFFERYDISNLVGEAVLVPWLVFFAVANLMVSAGFLSALCGPRSETFAVNVVAGLTRFPALACLLTLFVGMGAAIWYGLGETVFSLLQTPDAKPSLADAGAWTTPAALFTLGLLFVFLLFWWDCSRIYLFRRYDIEQDIPQWLQPLWWMVKPIPALCLAAVAMVRRPFRFQGTWLVFLAAPLCLAAYQQMQTTLVLLPLWLVQVVLLARMLLAMMRLSFLGFWVDPITEVSLPTVADTGAGAFDGLEQYTEEAEPGAQAASN